MRETKTERRAAARARARAARERERRKARLRRIAIQGGIGLVIVAAAVAVALVVTQNTKPVGPGPRNMASGGIHLTGDGSTIRATRTPAVAPDKIRRAPTPSPTSTATTSSTPVQIVVYQDLQCPACRQFEATNSAYIEQAVRDGAATLDLHPISILDAASLGNRYSTRSANAIACVADHAPDRVLDANTALFAQQPDEGTKGRTDGDLVRVLRDAGITDTAVRTCVEQKTHSRWVTAVSKRATSENVPGSSLDRISGTPTILVNGKQYRGGLASTEEFQQFVQTAAR